MARQISEITRRDLWEALAEVRWWGRLDEIEFLKRLYPLAHTKVAAALHTTNGPCSCRLRIAECSLDRTVL